VIKLLSKLITRELDEDQNSARKPPIPLAQLGEVFVPDTEGQMVLSTSLLYDDAPWISASLPPNSNKFMHSNFSSEEAKILGAKSLRAQLFSGDEIVCPEASAITKLLGTDGVEDLLADLLAFTNYIDGTGLHLVFDGRTYDSESLMHPGLTEAQGPALVAYIEGPLLSSESVMQYLGNPVMLPALSEDRAHKSTDHEMRIYPKCGKRLATCFALTDCLQILTGKDFYLFDPCGTYLLRGDAKKELLAHSKPVPISTKSRSQSVLVTAGEKKQIDNSQAVSVPAPAVAASHVGTPAVESARAQKRVVTTGRPNSRGPSSSTKSISSDTSTGENDILHRFPNQFAGFLQLPFRVEESLMSAEGLLRGVIIRMPLRKRSSSLSQYVPVLEDVKAGLREYKNLLRCSLVLGTSLVSGSVAHFEESVGKVQTDFEVGGPHVSIQLRDILCWLTAAVIEQPRYATATVEYPN
jgi:hypothetical protein